MIRITGPASAELTFVGFELCFEPLFELDQVLGKRHAIGFELIELLPDLQVKLMPVRGLILHSREKKSEFRLNVFERHVSVPVPVAQDKTYRSKVSDFGR